MASQSQAIIESCKSNIDVSSRETVPRSVPVPRCNTFANVGVRAIPGTLFLAITDNGDAFGMSFLPDNDPVPFTRYDHIYPSLTTLTGVVNNCQSLLAFVPRI